MVNVAFVCLGNICRSPMAVKPQNVVAVFINIIKALLDMFYRSV
ncbi:MAG: hypothetical protein K2K60_03540, partial [Clostridia bacterium]|nr:hypothetical protein [Clostridia bacterium]